jgi:surface carbohydrate biosynthesis protein
VFLFHFLARRRVDVLIYDEVGSVHVKKVVPVTAKVAILPVREKIPLVLSLGLLRTFLSVLWLTKSQIRSAYLMACIEQYSPRVVISFTDNSPVMGMYGNLRPHVLVISVQNAIRSLRSVKTQIRRAPIYASLGSATKELFSQAKIDYQEIRPVGSLPLGIFLCSNKNRTDARQIAFVSSFRASYLSSTEPFETSQRLAHIRCFQWLLNYCREKNLLLTVIAKGKVRNEGEHFTVEKEFFHRLANGIPFHFESAVKDSWKPYQIALNCEMLVVIDSTLGYEALSVGKRVLFGWHLHEHLAKVGEFFTRYLPSELLLEGATDTELSDQADFIRGLDECQYEDLIAASKSIYVKQSESSPPHEKLKCRIVEHLEARN